LETPAIKDSSSDANPAVLLCDDEQLMRRVLRTLLTSRGYTTYESGTGEEILSAVPGLKPDVIVLDLGLPDIDGIEVIRRLRQLVRTPIIILSVRAAASDKIAALDAGADDYLTKPYQPAELCERVRAAVHRMALNGEPVWSAGDLAVDPERTAVQVGQRTVSLSAPEYALLRELVENAGRLLTQQRLARAVWGDRSADEALQMLRTTIASLRSKLETDPARPHHIITEPGVGYRLRVEL
jgi:two-component system, OmpR family, KDP operon response regulator KdpE